MFTNLNGCNFKCCFILFVNKKRILWSSFFFKPLKIIIVNIYSYYELLWCKIRCRSMQTTLERRSVWALWLSFQKTFCSIFFHFALFVAEMVTIVLLITRAIGLDSRDTYNLRFQEFFILVLRGRSSWNLLFSSTVLVFAPFTKERFDILIGPLLHGYPRNRTFRQTSIPCLYLS